MPTAGSWAWGFDPRLFDVLSGLGDLTGKVQRDRRPDAGRPWPRHAPRACGPGPRRTGPGACGTGPVASARHRAAGGQGRPARCGAEGDVRAAILAVLGEDSRNGYQVISEIEERSGGAWRPSPGAVYPALSQLG